MNQHFDLYNISGRRRKEKKFECARHDQEKARASRNPGTEVKRNSSYLLWREIWE
jgi:hypothetical protein